MHVVSFLVSRAAISWRITVYDAKKVTEYAKNLDPQRKDTLRF